jgi:hypothetical protein
MACFERKWLLVNSYWLFVPQFIENQYVENGGATSRFIR